MCRAPVIWKGVHARSILYSLASDRMSGHDGRTIWSMQLLALSATQQARLIRERKISSMEIVQAHLEQIRRVNPAIHAAIEVFADRALAEARAADAMPARAPMHGVPFSVK